MLRNIHSIESLCVFDDNKMKYKKSGSLIDCNNLTHLTRMTYASFTGYCRLLNIHNLISSIQKLIAINTNSWGFSHCNISNLKLLTYLKTNARNCIINLKQNILLEYVDCCLVSDTHSIYDLDSDNFNNINVRSSLQHLKICTNSIQSINRNNISFEYSRLTFLFVAIYASTKSIELNKINSNIRVLQLFGIKYEQFNSLKNLRILKLTENDQINNIHVENLPYLHTLSLTNYIEAKISNNPCLKIITCEIIDKLTLDSNVSNVTKLTLHKIIEIDGLENVKYMLQLHNLNIINSLCNTNGQCCSVCRDTSHFNYNAIETYETDHHLLKIYLMKNLTELKILNSVETGLNLLKFTGLRKLSVSHRQKNIQVNKITDVTRKRI